MTTTQTYQVDKTRKLIDLNGDSINFEATFRVKSRNGELFDLIAVDQTTLDNEPNLQFQKVKGEISGTINHNKNEYQNYFLVLRADNPCTCDVEINKRDLPKTEFTSKQLRSPEENEENVPENEEKSTFSKLFTMKNILIVISICIIIWLIYLYFTRSKEHEIELPKVDQLVELPKLSLELPPAPVELPPAPVELHKIELPPVELHKIELPPAIEPLKMALENVMPPHNVNVCIDSAISKGVADCPMISPSVCGTPLSSMSTGAIMEKLRCI